MTTLLSAISALLSLLDRWAEWRERQADRADGAREQREADHAADDAMRDRVDAAWAAQSVDPDERLRSAGRLRD